MSNSLGPDGLYSHGILQASILEWVAFPFSGGGGGLSQRQGSNPGLLHCGWILYQLSYQESPIKASHLDGFCGLTNTHNLVRLFLLSLH